MIVRTCPKCHETYPHTPEFFYRDKHRKSGLCSWCRKCSGIRARAYHHDNKEKCRLKRKRYYVLNRVGEYAKNSAYRKTRRGHIAGIVGAIKQRCNNPINPGYANYGGRGISLCFTPSELYDWCVTRNIDPRGLDIHRKLFGGDYTLDNIEFLTRSQHTTLHNLEGH